MDIRAIESRHTSGVYPKRDLVLVRGEGVYVWDEAGRRYLDATGGQGVALLGHNPLAVQAALREQMGRLMICPEIFYNDRRAQLLEALQDILPGSQSWRIFLCNSGAEAVEAAIKFARWRTGRAEIIAARRAFHGRTMGALSATWNPAYRQPFEPLVPGFRHIPFNDIGALEAAIGPQTAAVILEPVQGEGGVWPADPTFLQAARELCDRYGAALIFDEVQTGFGRTGRWFAAEHYGVLPDLIAMGKGMAGGFPIGAVAFLAEWGPLPAGAHGSTFGGNPMACAAALAVIETLRRERLIEGAAQRGAWFQERLRQIRSPMVREIRGIGLMIGVALRGRATPILRRMMEDGVLALPAGPDVVRFLPPLIIEPEHLEQIAAALERALIEAPLPVSRMTEGGEG
ncbi:aspartate aminotransferase family protein [Thermoflexus sp.]|uniref:aspartate aminotransferase family protein n=1 Tax=Thermoflexus sp. TaxID=1969742 RepID=UPI0025D72BE8|nr:aspartate aminotransferase family protein [Thermoflexus sp.]MDW8179406.1 aspartate aminotransferase family protein [Anaerolineae bacterium]MCS6963510.1 aspartate aminotransferase family protein [Thermoflexus sp.]MCS7349958.1 aspartate aminotransferase family protein [Thermoflexus sp.]MCX7689644.1 aspartate aminotransferase family protein [Thermoflexus sp.]MDW8184780.1 aspartate aminotransferase family protein [Anaerolineae bacterium]